MEDTKAYKEIYDELYEKFEAEIKEKLIEDDKSYDFETHKDEFLDENAFSNDCLSLLSEGNDYYINLVFNEYDDIVSDIYLEDLDVKFRNLTKRKLTDYVLYKACEEVCSDIVDSYIIEEHNRIQYYKDYAEEVNECKVVMSYISGEWLKNSCIGRFFNRALIDEDENAEEYEIAIFLKERDKTLPEYMTEVYFSSEKLGSSKIHYNKYNTSSPFALEMCIIEDHIMYEDDEY